MSAEPEVELIFTTAYLEKIALMSNISKTVTDSTMGSMKVECKTIPGLSIDTMTLTLDNLELSRFKVITITYISKL